MTRREAREIALQTYMESLSTESLDGMMRQFLPEDWTVAERTAIRRELAEILSDPDNYPPFLRQTSPAPLVSNR